MKSSGGHTLYDATVANDVDAPKVAFVVKTKKDSAGHINPRPLKELATSNGNRPKDISGRLRVNRAITMIYDGVEGRIPFDWLNRGLGEFV